MLETTATDASAELARLAEQRERAAAQHEDETYYGNAACSHSP